MSTLPTIDHTAFPHIIDTILACADRGVLLAFRATSHEFQERIDKACLGHLILSGSPVAWHARDSSHLHMGLETRTPTKRDDELYALQFLRLALGWTLCSGASSSSYPWLQRLGKYTRVLDTLNSSVPVVDHLVPSKQCRRSYPMTPEDDGSEDAYAESSFTGCHLFAMRSSVSRFAGYWYHDTVPLRIAEDAAPGASPTLQGQKLDTEHGACTSYKTVGSITWPSCFHPFQLALQHVQVVRRRAGIEATLPAPTYIDFVPLTTPVVRPLALDVPCPPSPATTKWIISAQCTTDVVRQHEGIIYCGSDAVPQPLLEDVVVIFTPPRPPANAAPAKEKVDQPGEGVDTKPATKSRTPHDAQDIQTPNPLPVAALAGYLISLIPFLGGPHGYRRPRIRAVNITLVGVDHLGPLTPGHSGMHPIAGPVTAPAGFSESIVIGDDANSTSAIASGLGLYLGTAWGAIEFVSHAEYRKRVGAEEYDLETVFPPGVFCLYGM